MLAGMPKRKPAVQIRSRRQEVGRPISRRFSQRGWWSFSRDRRRQYLTRIEGLPGIEQANRIDALVSLEWIALRNEREALDLVGREAREAAREARNARGLMLKALNDFERELRRPPAKPPAKTLDQVLDEIAAKAAAERAGVAEQE
jgi:hypothetical protein